MLRIAGSLVTNQVRAYDLPRMFGREGHPTQWSTDGKDSVGEVGIDLFLLIRGHAHRMVFRCGMRAPLVTVSNRLALVGVAQLMLAMSSSLMVVAMVLGTGRSAVLVAAMLSGVVWLWFGMSLW
ncbi:transposase [Streptomyces goshikiensis]|uniref:Transposase n=3 Tax=Streptomyces TaxID=1883 RepID=A0ABZ1RDD6_9ACTN|nr:DUF6328 family protein [Streptomyces goshikiensis]WSX95882.1 transposase [Streptomyces goshikiensis]